MPAKMIPNDNVDVRVGSKDALKQLTELLKKNKIVLVLIYADWCGHCQTFKKGEWATLQGEPGRKIPMAQIQAEALDKTPLADTPVDGYPYVGVVGQDRRMANIANPRDMRTMRAVVNADPEEVLSGSPAENVPMNVESEEENEAADVNMNGAEEDEDETLSEPMDSATAESQANQFQETLNTIVPGSASLAADEYSTTGTMNAATAANGSKRGPAPSATMARINAGPSAAPATPPDLAGDVAATANGTGNNFTGKRVSLNTVSASGPLMGGSLFATLKGIASNGIKIASSAVPQLPRGGGARKTRRNKAAAGSKPRRRLTARKLRR
jgi:thiol-disulfide isomerase/thioredoxin